MALDTAQLATQALVVLTSLYVGYRIGARPSSEEELEPEVAMDNAEEEPVPEEPIWDGDLAAIKAGMTDQCKMVLVVRTDLKMKAGDISCQCAKATLACYKTLQEKNPKLVRHWEITGQAKIALKGKSEEQLMELEAIAKSLNLCARSVSDEELTKNAEGSRTVLAIGPAPIKLVNEVTGELRLL
ncbi:peptidyl-tRNA hydrolase II [Schizopora paradoxa]|uniref:peptidyl-tRNA hydrolase n=1 Tax=Schizopora paradoxa TaxID=27342 RepID=A0A0H2S8I9_9AGAM|nr:peptidyl-tRNA hydrolase II [Schizopora paradoxa]